MTADTPEDLLERPHRATEESHCADEGASEEDRQPEEIIADLQALEESDLTRLRELAWELADALSGCDRLNVEIHREAAIRALQGKVKAPAKIVDAALAEERRSENLGKVSQGSAVAFSEPEPWPDSVNSTDLLDQLSSTFKRYIVLPADSASALALWVVHTYAFKAAWITPRLAITSPEKRCAKTLVLVVLEHLVSKALMTANVTAAVVFRCIDKFQLSLLVDEADTFLGDKDELRGILNSGHRRGGKVLRVAGDDHEPRAFHTFAPVAIAMIGKLPDTLADRSIVIAMRRKKREERVETLRLDRLDYLEELRRCCARWAQDHFYALQEADPEVPSELNDRAADNWRPLLAIADVVGGDWPERARQSAVVLSKTKSGGNHSTGTMLLADIRDAFRSRGADVMESKEMLADLLEREDRCWGEWRRGEPLSAIGMSTLLKRFDIRPRQIRMGDKKIRGYRLAWFEDAFARYLPPDPVHPVHPSADGGSRDLRSRYTDGAVPTSKSAANPCAERVVPVVPGREPGTEAEGSETWGEIL